MLLLHGFPDSRATCGGIRSERSRDAGFRVDRARPARASATPTSRPTSSAYRVGRSVGDVVAILDALEIETGARRRPRLGRRRRLGARADGARARGPARRAVGRPPGRRAHALARAREVLVHAAVPVPGGGGAPAPRRLGASCASGRRRTPSSTDVARDAWRRSPPALNWYRANLHPRRELEPPRGAPAGAGADTLGVWSSGDVYLTERADDRLGRVRHGSWRYERIDGAGHWMQLDAPDASTRCCLTSCA